jgi:hypothetical protein
MSKLKSYAVIVNTSGEWSGRLLAKSITHAEPS